MPEPIRTYSSFSEILEGVRAVSRRDAKNEHCESPVLVGIDGGGGSGKSSLSEKLSEALAGAQIIHLDDFADWSDDSNWELSTFAERALEPLVAGITSKHRRYDWPTDTFAEWFEIEPSSIAIVEGVTALRVDLREYWGVGIWVDCPRELRLERGIARDGEEIRSKWEDQWMPGEDAYFQHDRPWEAADFAFDGTGAGGTDFVLRL